MAWEYENVSGSGASARPRRLVQTGTDSNLSSIFTHTMRPMGVTNPVARYVIGGGQNNKTIYVVSGVGVKIEGVLDQDSDRELLCIVPNTSGNASGPILELIGTWNYGIKANGEPSIGTGLRFTNAPNPIWSRAGTAGTDYRGTTFVIRDGTNALDNKVTQANFNWRGGIIEGPFTMSIISGVGGVISGDSTFNVLDTGQGAGSEFVMRIYSVDIDIQSLRHDGGTLSFGQGTAGGVYTMNRSRGGIGVIPQPLSSVPLTFRNINFTGNIVDIGVWDNGAFDEPSTTFIANSATGSNLNIRGAEAGVNPQGAGRSGDFRNAGYIVLYRDIAITSSSPVGNLDAICVIRDNNNGARKNIQHSPDDAGNNPVGVRDDRATAFYRATITGGSSTTPNSITLWEVTAESTQVGVTQDCWGARNARRNNFNNSGDPSMWTGSVPRIVTAIVNVVDPALVTSGAGRGISGTILARNVRGTSGSTSSAGVYQKDLRGKTNVQGEDLFDFHAFSYRGNYLTVERSLLGDGTLTINLVFVLDLNITQTDDDIVENYTSLETSAKIYDWFKLYLYNNYRGETETLVSKIGNTIGFGNSSVFLATDYDDLQAYIVGDVIYRNIGTTLNPINKFQRCTSNTSGAYNSSNWTNVLTTANADSIGLVNSGEFYIYYGSSTLDANVTTTGMNNNIRVANEADVIGTIRDSTGVRFVLNLPNATFYRGNYGTSNTPILYDTILTGQFRLNVEPNTEIRMAIKPPNNYARYFVFNAGPNGVVITPEFTPIQGTVNTYSWLNSTNLDLTFTISPDSLNLVFNNVNTLDNLWVDQVPAIVNYLEADSDYLQAVLSRATQGFIQTNDIRQMLFNTINVSFNLDNSETNNYPIQVGYVLGTGVSLTTPRNANGREVLLINLVEVANNLSLQGSSNGMTIEALQSMIETMNNMSRFNSYAVSNVQGGSGSGSGVIVRNKRYPI